MLSVLHARTLTTIALLPLLVGMVGCKSQESTDLHAKVESAEASVKQSIERLPVVGPLVPKAIATVKTVEAKLGVPQAKQAIRKDLSVADQDLDAFIARIKYVGSLPICPPGTPDNQSCDGSSSTTASPAAALVSGEGYGTPQVAPTAPTHVASTKADTGPSMDDLQVH